MGSSTIPNTPGVGNQLSLGSRVLGMENITTSCQLGSAINAVTPWVCAILSTINRPPQTGVMMCLPTSRYQRINARNNNMFARRSLE